MHWTGYAVTCFGMVCIVLLLLIYLAMPLIPWLLLLSILSQTFSKYKDCKRSGYAYAMALADIHPPFSWTWLVQKADSEWNFPASSWAKMIFGRTAMIRFDCCSWFPGFGCGLRNLLVSNQVIGNQVMRLPSYFVSFVLVWQIGSSYEARIMFYGELKSTKSLRLPVRSSCGGHHELWYVQTVIVNVRILGLIGLHCCPREIFWEVAYRVWGFLCWFIVLCNLVGRHESTSREAMERPPHQKVGLAALLKHHLRDWLGILVMIALELVVYIAISPFHRFVDKVKMQEYMFPTGPDTVPTWTIGVCILCHGHMTLSSPACWR